MSALIFPLGSCRIHRPFKKRVNEKLFDNLIEGISIVYPRIGFLHSPYEALQTLKVLSGQMLIHPSFLKFCFRKENPKTTPDNEFLPELLTGALNHAEVGLEMESFSQIEIFLIEISSLTANFHKSSGLYFISNPNLYMDGVSYADIYPDGFYSKFAPELGVEKRELSSDEVEECFRAISKVVGGRPVIYFGHLNHPDRPSATRKKLNSVVSQAAAAVGAHFFNSEDFIREFGYLVDSNGREDIHHLSHEGELKIGKEIQNFCLKIINEIDK